MHLQRLPLHLGPLVMALCGPGDEPHGGSGSEFRNYRPFSAARLSHIKPLLLPDLDGLDKGPLRPRGVGQLADHSSAAVRVLPIDHLRLHIEDLEPQAKMWVDAEESLTHDDECRDVEERVRG